MRRSAAGVALMLACAAGPSAAEGVDPQWAQGRQLFMQGAVPSCTVCHTLRDAGSQGAVGPVLDELKPDAQRVATALRSGVGAMPSYRALLTEAQIQALAVYVSRASAASH